MTSWSELDNVVELDAYREEEVDRLEDWFRVPSPPGWTLTPAGEWAIVIAALFLIFGMIALGDWLVGAS